MSLFTQIVSLFGSQTSEENINNKSEFNEFLKDLKLIKLPEDVVMLTDKVVVDEAKNLYSILKSIDYKSHMDRYKKNEWNSWEISILMDMYNRGKDFKLHDVNDVMLKDILALSFDDLTALVKGLVRKYEKNVNMENGKHLLIKQKIWNASEVSALLLYLHKFNTEVK